MEILHPRCPVCGDVSESQFQPCGACERDMFPDAFPRCSMCAADLAGADNPCPDCRDRIDVLDGMSALGPWAGALREWLSILKFGGDARMAACLVQGLITLAGHRWPGLPVIPVPPRRAAVRRRGGDTVSLLARGMEEAGFSVRRLLIRRGRGTQKGLNRRERIRGERLRFEMKPGARPPEAAILLDDVVTTGATLRRCASVLKTSGAKGIYALTVCRD